jgi:hypothetical protein
MDIRVHSALDARTDSTAIAGIAPGAETVERFGQNQGRRLLADPLRTDEQIRGREPAWALTS